MRAVTFLARYTGTSRSVPHQLSVGVIYYSPIRQRGLGMWLLSSLVRVHIHIRSLRFAFFKCSTLPASRSTMSYKWFSRMEDSARIRKHKCENAFFRTVLPWLPTLLCMSSRKQWAGLSVFAARLSLRALIWLPPLSVRTRLARWGSSIQTQIYTSVLTMGKYFVFP